MINNNYSNLKKNVLFIVVGRLGFNLVVSKTLPAISTGLFSQIYIFSEKQGIELPGVKYVTLPKLLTKLKPAILSKLIRLFYEPIQLTIYSFRFKPAIIHGYYTIPKGLNSLFSSRISRSSCIISLIGGKEEIETSFFIKQLSRPLIIRLLKSADFITTKGVKDNRYLDRYGIGKDKISIFNGAIDTQKFCHQGENKDIELLFAGYFDEFKGPQRALEIVRLILKELPDIKTVFIGKGPLFQNIVERVEEAGLSSSITFEGYVDNSEVFFKRAKILIFPSANEGLSTAMLEAMACRCVPITSDVGNQTEAAYNGINSIVITDYTDIQSFAKEAIRILKDESLLTSLADNAEKTILSKYTPEKQGELCYTFYSKLILSQK